MSDWKKQMTARWHRFRQWQLSPEPAAPMTATEHDCLNCGEHYAGNYCPRCGQSAATARYTVRHAMTYVADVWGLGSQGMLRTILHLLLRPGRMIRDYLDGHRAPYFSPFKMLFVVVTILYLLYNILPGEQVAQTSAEIRSAVGEVQSDGTQEVDDVRSIFSMVNRFIDWSENNRALSSLFGALFVALMTSVVFRRPPARPDMNLAEHFVANILIDGQVFVLSLIYLIGYYAFTLKLTYTLPPGVIPLVYLVDFRLLYGYSWWGTLWRLVALVALYLAIIFLLVLIVGIGVGIHVAMNAA